MTDLVALSKEWIDEKKKVFGKIMKINIGGEVLVYRFLKTSDMDGINDKYKDFIDISTQNILPEKIREYENDILKLSVIYPENFDPGSLTAQARPTLFEELSKAGIVIEEPVEL